jgi:ABC-type transport system involved in cytochrome c biogenesis permease component
MYEHDPVYWIGYTIGTLVMLSFMLGIYMAPMIVALWRHHPRKWWIGFLNFAAGWTVVGWIAALVWAVTAFQTAKPVTRIAQAAE